MINSRHSRESGNLEKVIKGITSYDLAPEVIGVIESYEGAKWFLETAVSLESEIDRFRLLIAGIYFGRAIIEIMLEALKKYSASDCYKDNFYIEVRARVQLVDLIKKIRIHHFHRLGVQTNTEDGDISFFSGPISLKSTQGNIAFMQIPLEGAPVIQTANPKSIANSKYLLQRNKRFWDEETKRDYTLEQALSLFLGNMPETIEWFKEELDSRFRGNDELI